MTSYRLPIDPRRAAAARLIGHVRSELQKALVEEKAERKLTQQHIADLLDVNRSVINRHFLGNENLTLRTIAELAWALGREVRFELPSPARERGVNVATTVTVEVMDDEPGTLPRASASTSTSDDVWEIEAGK